jgi:hypothetical protein
MIFPLVVGWQWGLNTSYLLCRAAGGVGVGVGVWCLVFAEYYLRSTMIFENARTSKQRKDKPFSQSKVITDH